MKMTRWPPSLIDGNNDWRDHDRSSEIPDELKPGNRELEFSATFYPERAAMTGIVAAVLGVILHELFLSYEDKVNALNNQMARLAQDQDPCRRLLALAGFGPVCAFYEVRL